MDGSVILHQAAQTPQVTVHCWCLCMFWGIPKQALKNEVAGERKYAINLAGQFTAYVTTDVFTRLVHVSVPCSGTLGAVCISLSLLQTSTTHNTNPCLAVEISPIGASCSSNCATLFGY
jgi:hypothetical protein